MSPQPDFAKLTAYALGELEESERIAVAAKLIRSEPSRQYVAEMRQLADEIVVGLSREPPLALTDEQRRTIERCITRATRERAVRLRGSRVWAVPLAAAACLLVGVVSYGFGKYFAPTNPGSAGTAERVDGARQEGPPEVGVVTPLWVPQPLFRPTTIPVGIPPGPPGVTADRSGVIATRDAPGRSVVDIQPSRELRRFEPPGAPWPESAPFVAVANAPVSRVTGSSKTGPSHTTPSKTTAGESGTLAGISYTALAEQITRGELPEPGKIELGDILNNFEYQHTDVVSNEAFSIQADVVPSPDWNSHLILIGVRGKGGDPVVARDLSVKIAFDASRVQSYRWLGAASVTEEPAHSGGGPVDTLTISSVSSVSSDYRLAALCEVVASAAVQEDGVARQAYNSSVPPGTELMRLHLSYLPPVGEETRTLSVPVRYAGQQLATAPPDFKFALAVCGWGLTVKSLARASQEGSPASSERSVRVSLLRIWAEVGLGPDADPDRTAFIELLKATEKLESGK